MSVKRTAHRRGCGTGPGEMRRSEMKLSNGASHPGRASSEWGGTQGPADSQSVATELKARLAGPPRGQVPEPSGVGQARD